MEDLIALSYKLLALSVIIYLAPRSLKAWITRSKLNHIPTIGPSGILSSYIGAYRMLHHPHDMIQEGYNKYYGTAFKVPTIGKWFVVVSGPQMVDDLRKATDETVSFREALVDVIQTDYTLGPEIHHDPWHVGTVRSPLTRNLGIRFSDIQDEIEVSFADLVPKTREWAQVPALNTIMKIVCRTSNRLFVGLPLCRNPDYRALNEEFTIRVFQAGYIINLFPNIFKPIAGRLFTNVPASIKRATLHLGPIIQERLDQEDKCGPNWPGKPNDLISWLIGSVPGRQHTIHSIVMRILTVNVAAIHTTSMAFTRVLYDLAARPSYVPALREEIKSVIDNEGLTKSALGKMRNLDSFIKESQRMSGVGAVSMVRKILKDFTFSDGTTVPAGVTVAVAGSPTHLNADYYSKPEEFDGLRFARLRECDGEGTKHQMTSLSLEYVVFGNGRHACPGRFFAATQLKALLIHVLMNYDIKLTDGARPPDRWRGITARIPHPTAAVMFRERRDYEGMNEK
ncbi:cytochrome P450 [Collybia nuda]|uniref:Cytochrome P450 n=1 Tax=Collybia nuda TaxID=64659 RepID=A0A9P6CQA2_9AGAR|nr:cytochrome P450 [Collybia nuda]